MSSGLVLLYLVFGKNQGRQGLKREWGKSGIGEESQRGWYLVSCTWYLVFGIRYLVFGKNQGRQGLKREWVKSGIGEESQRGWYLVFGIQYLIFGI